MSPDQDARSSNSRDGEPNGSLPGLSPSCTRDAHPRITLYEPEELMIDD